MKRFFTIFLIYSLYSIQPSAAETSAPPILLPPELAGAETLSVEDETQFVPPSGGVPIVEESRAVRRIKAHRQTPQPADTHDQTASPQPSTNSINSNYTDKKHPKILITEATQTETTQTETTQTQTNATSSVTKKKAKASLPITKAIAIATRTRATKIVKSASMTPGKPKLAIIIDDMISARQLQNAQALGLTLNYSFIPPSRLNPHSAKVAAQLDEYLIHLPLQARNFARPEPNTLNVDDSAATINQRIATTKRQFPKARFVNNHTGSRFTANQDAMQRLFTALKNQQLNFIDSVTTTKTLGSTMQKQFDMPNFSRDIFFDNQNDKAAIVAQIRKAVAVAKKRGVAIAIAHPRPNTLAVMRHYKHLFNNVELIRVSQLASAYAAAKRYRANHHRQVAKAAGTEKK